MIKTRIVLAEEWILTACSNHKAISSSCCQQNFQKKPLGAMCFVMAKLDLEFKPKNKSRAEAVPNVVIVNSSMDDEHPTNKRSTSKECFCSAAILGRVVCKSYCDVFLYQV